MIAMSLGEYILVLYLFIPGLVGISYCEPGLNIALPGCLGQVKLEVGQVKSAVMDR